MKCFQHYDLDAVGMCRACGAGGCGHCLTDYGGAKLCLGCAHHTYRMRLGEASASGDYARKRLFRAAVVAAAFGSIGFFMWGLGALESGVFTAFLAGTAGAIWCGYGWSTAYLGIPPFMRFFGSRMTGGAISSSLGGALFGALWFWVVAGWWLLFFASLFAFFGGGLWQAFSLFRSLRRSQTELASIPPPAPAQPAAAYFAPSTPAA